MNFWKRTFATLAAFAILLGAVPELPAPLAAPVFAADEDTCLLYTSPSPRDTERSRMPSSA